MIERNQVQNKSDQTQEDQQNLRSLEKKGGECFKT